MLHPQWHQTATGTGRLSCSRPNLQATPRRANAPGGSVAADTAAEDDADDRSGGDDDDDDADVDVDTVYADADGTDVSAAVLISENSATTADNERAPDPMAVSLPSVRSALVARAGCVFIAADYSQMEMRVAAALCGDPQLARALSSAGGDMYCAMAAQCFAVPERDVTPTQRDAAKTMSLGILYGMGTELLAQKVRNITLTSTKTQLSYVQCTYVNYIMR